MAAELKQASTVLSHRLLGVCTVKIGGKQQTAVFARQGFAFSACFNQPPDIVLICSDSFLDTRIVNGLIFFLGFPLRRTCR
ncbi:hypothetical protein QBD00_004094 [Ochrobactrum sp. AN78]|jgi:hypothetical protein|nr:hypothetical protein [Ochrobactrum sp. AN78]